MIGLLAGVMFRTMEDTRTAVTVGSASAGVVQETKSTRGGSSELAGIAFGPYSYQLEIRWGHMFYNTILRCVVTRRGCLKTTVEDELDVKKIIGGAGLLVVHINSR
ncbi:hypothetical protein NL676_006907 [Syzygium grande]|nr:hypothetical protein NL676_006907 [Syzygium grande]